METTPLTTRNQLSSKVRGYHENIIAAIEQGEVLHLKYQDNSRKVVPLVYGVLKNGKRALLCYKIGEPGDNMPELAIRLYHFDKISDLERSGQLRTVDRKIDYYLTKHFASVYKRC